MKPWIIIDCPNVASVALHATGHLVNGTIHGFLKQVLAIQHQFDSDKIVFAFDSGHYKRREILPTYKAHREQKRLHGTREEVDAYLDYKRQLKELQNDILPRVGFRNVFSAEGYEADDIMASVVGILDTKQLLVSRDSDVLQLLHPHTEIWLPVDKRLVTYDSFMAEWGIVPRQWIDVKALAGCSTDGVPGINGVAIKTAIKYLTGNLKKGIILDRIVASQEIMNRNVKLVRLPYKGCPTFKVREDVLSRDAWKEIMREYRMTSLISSFPKGCVA